MKKFLTSNWRDLVLANYAIEPALLTEFVPSRTSLDYHDGKCYVSLVAFQFTNTKVLNFAIPFHVDFEEVNLRFYVKRETAEETKRGVVFIKEIVPRHAIAFIARTLYGEPYETWAMSSERQLNELEYFWWKGDCDNRLSIEIGACAGVPDENSHGEFIIEHYWGYTRRGANQTDEYKVEHPKWELFDVDYAEIDVDFGFTYGEQFAFLTDTEPNSIFMAKGSAVSVYKGAKLIGNK